MYEIETIPGPCAFCYQVFVELKRIPGMSGDGICEVCDEIRAFVLDHRFVKWDEQKMLAKRRAAAAARPVVQGTARIPHAVALAYQRHPQQRRPAAAVRRAG